MTTNELYLKTFFCCIACDEEIAPEEVDLTKQICIASDLFGEIDVEKHLNLWIQEINEKGQYFLRNYLSELAEAELSEEEQMTIIDLALKAIEADNRIEYAEVKFFKKIRIRLPVSDEIILSKYPDKEDFLLPDNNVYDDPVWDKNTQFSEIKL